LAKGCPHFVQRRDDLLADLDLMLREELLRLARQRREIGQQTVADFVPDALDGRLEIRPVLVPLFAGIGIHVAAQLERQCDGFREAGIALAQQIHERVVPKRLFGKHSRRGLPPPIFNVL
jgi:hypothetical protein